MQADVYEDFLLRHSDKHGLCEMIRMMIVFSTNSAGPERRFSLQNGIKTKARNRMTDLTVNDAVHIVANRVSQCEMDYLRAAKMLSCTDLPKIL
jgi:hypothetical protein